MTNIIISPAVLPLIIHAGSARFTPSSSGPVVGGFNLVGSVAWPSANRAIYVPVSLPFSYPVARVFWVNGATANGNVDMGIYGVDGNKIYSTGAVAQSGTTASQYVVAGITLPAGAYYFALSLSSGTGTIEVLTSAIVTANLEFLGLLQEASAHPLPSSMTPAAISSAFWPMFGITQLASGY